MYRRQDGKLIVSATDLVGFLACGHLTQLERAAAKGLIHRPSRVDPEVELLRRRGYEHEERYIREKLAGRQVTRLPEKDSAGEGLPLETRAAQTIEAMSRGDPVIFQATVFDGRWRGHPDFLLRTAGKSELGDYHYEVADTKLAHSAKASALIQICSYVDQIEGIQGVRPEKVYVVTGGARILAHEFRTAEMMAYYRAAKRRLEDAIDEAVSGEPVWPIGREASYPDPVEHCAVCRWFPDFCRQTWRDDDALPLVAGISRSQRQLLTSHGVATRRGLSELSKPLELGLKRAGADSMWRMREQARLQVTSDGLAVPVFELLEPERDIAGGWVSDRGLSALPEPSAGDLFFDIEGDPFAFWEGLEYLFGIWFKPTGGGLWEQGRYQGFWALDRAQEKQAFERVVDLFVERWRADPRMHIYHYGVYEPSHLKVLAGRHATREEELDQLLRGRVFVDLYRVVRQGVRVGAERYSIKNLEPLYGYRREINLRDANSSIVEFERLLEIGDPGGELTASIEGYNQDDCRSTEALRDWLEARRRDAAATWGDLPRPAPGEQEVSQELSDRLRAVRELETRMTASISTVAADQTEAERATWLVRHLLDWHRRENKASWWRFFELMTLSDEELAEEPEPIARLAFVDTIEPGGRVRGVDHRYRFPPQEHKVEVGHEVHDPDIAEGETRTGFVVALDEAAGTIDIRRPRDWAGRHPEAIVPLNIFRSDAQQAALMRFGEWVAAHDVADDSADWQAVRDLLLRRPPRGGQSAGERLKRQGETGSAAALRLATQLDGTTLAIQGPPGSGKTYIGARMILKLVQAGRRVGITANSHKVITNLLDALGKAAAEQRVTVRGMQKVEGEDGCKQEFVRCVADNGVVAQSLAAGEVDVVGGTAWLWSREQMAGLVDTLFVDEAGQMSLANVVAMSGCSRSIVLLGDPQQLDQPTQGAHPDGAGVSALAHLLGGAETVPEDRGLFLERTWRMHPEITGYTSELFYEGKLDSVDGLEKQRVLGDGDWTGSGLRWVPVVHDGNTNASPEEATKVVDIVKSLVGREWVNEKGDRQSITPEDIRIVSPYNAHRLLIDQLLKDASLAGVPVGTVDKFQGQEAAVSIYTMATSRPEDAPRGLGFLYSLNRLNVATSRARALAIVVASPELLRAVPRTPDQLRMVNGLCAFEESARANAVPTEPPATEPPPGGPWPIQLLTPLG